MLFYRFLKSRFRIDMLAGGHNPNVSLLPDNPGIRIEAVQGGGGLPSMPSTQAMQKEWQSVPLLIENVAEYKPVIPHGALKKFQSRWRQTLGPSVPSRRKPRQDPHVIVGILNVIDTPVFVVAPLRGDEEAAKKVLGWASDLLQSEPSSHIIFMGPVLGATGSFIQNGLSSLIALYPGHAIHISEKESTIPSLDGILLHAIPDTSKQVALGFIPSHENVYQRSSRALGSLTVETLRIPFSKAKEAEKSDSIYTLEFESPKTIKHREKDLTMQSIVHDVTLKPIPGWVTEIVFGQGVMVGGGMVRSIQPRNPIRCLT